MNRAPAAVVATAERAAIRRYQELDAKVDRAEGDGLSARWMFGREMLKEAEAHDGRMPHGRLEELVVATGKSRAELQQRHRFAKEYPKLPNALGSCRSWHDFVNPTSPGGDGKAALYTSESGDWETPQALFDVLHAEFGFDLDVCATKETAKCSRFFSPKDNGLTQEWRGVCWMNPPYGDEIAEWVGKAHQSAADGATVVCLVPARTDTAWWWNHCRFGEIRFLPGRLRFGESTTGAPFPSAVIVFPCRKPTVLPEAWWEWQKD